MSSRLEDAEERGYDRYDDTLTAGSGRVSQRLPLNPGLAHALDAASAQAAALRSNAWSPEEAEQRMADNTAMRVNQDQFMGRDKPRAVQPGKAHVRIVPHTPEYGKPGGW